MVPFHIICFLYFLTQRNLRSLFYYIPYASSSSTKKLRVGGCTEEVLAWFNYPRASAHPGAARWYWIDLHCCFTRASSRPAQWWRRLYRARKRTDPYPCCQASTMFVAWSMRISCCKRGTLQTRLRMGGCETLLPDVAAAEAHQNDHSYVRELSRPTFSSLRKNYEWCAVTRRTSKLSKLGVGACPGMGACPRQYSIQRSWSEESCALLMNIIFSFKKTLIHFMCVSLILWDK